MLTGVKLEAKQCHTAQNAVLLFTSNGMPILEDSYDCNGVDRAIPQVSGEHRGPSKLR